MHRSLSRLALLATAAASALAFATPALAAEPTGTILHADDARAIDGSYIVVLADDVTAGRTAAATESLASRYDADVSLTYDTAVHGFAATMSAGQAARLAADPAVAYVEQNRTVTAAGTQTPVPSWGLDRIDQRNLPLDDSYTYPNTGSGVNAYIVDTGIRFTHQEFGGRAVSGYDFIDDDPDASDCNGHGTHVAGTTGGSSYGVAKSVNLIGVRVLDCGGSGTYAQVIGGIDWVAADHDAGEAAVANMSLGGGFDQATNDAVAAAIADGVVFALAAGNDYGGDACSGSPGSTEAAITVGSTDSNDARSSFSNIGTCVDIFAPGRDITSAWYSSDTATNTISGTSMATPHVTGAAALVLAANPTYTPQQVRDKLVNDATDGIITDPGTGSPNKLLYVGAIQPPTQDFSLSVDPASGSTQPDATLTATVSTATTIGSPQTVDLSARGLPAGVTASFSPASVTSGGSATLSLNVSTAAAPGTYAVTIVGTGTETTQSARYSLTVEGAPGCSGSNGTDVAIPDNTTVESTITISGCAGTKTSASVEVHIVHTWIGDLTVSLVAPDGTAYVMHDRTGSSTDNIDQTYAVTLANETADGTWSLRVTDSASADTGHIDAWALVLGGDGGGGGGSCTGTNGTDVAIADNATAESGIAVDCDRAASATATVEVHVVHTWVGDLSVDLVAPDGTVYNLRKSHGGSHDNIDETYTVDLSGEAAAGTWTLRVTDDAAGDTGHIDTWTVTL